MMLGCCKLVLHEHSSLVTYVQPTGALDQLLLLGTTCLCNWWPISSAQVSVCCQRMQKLIAPMLLRVMHTMKDSLMIVVLNMCVLAVPVDKTGQDY